MLDIFKKVDKKNILYLDIETRALEKELKESSRLYDLVEYTVSRSDNFENEEDIYNFYNSKAALFPEISAICVISIGINANGQIRTTSFYGENEKELLEEFIGFLDAQQGKFDLICGFSSNSFDIPFILNRLFSNDIFNVPKILDESDKTPWTKVNFDLKDAVKLGRYSAPSLLGLTTLLGIDSPKQGITGKEVSKAFYDGRIEEIKDYCERDTAATANCLLRLQGKEILPSISVKIEKSYKAEGYKSELDKLLTTGDVDLEALAKEGAKLTKKEQEMYLKLTETLAK